MAEKGKREVASTTSHGPNRKGWPLQLATDQLEKMATSVSHGLEGEVAVAVWAPNGNLNNEKGHKGRQGKEREGEEMIGWRSLRVGEATMGQKTFGP